MDQGSQFDLSNRFFTLLAVLVIGVLIFFVGWIVLEQKSLNQQSSYQVTVSGEGKVYAKPDIALISLGVTTTGSTTADVITRNAEKMNAALKALKDLGVEDKDIQTTTYTLNPLYNYTETSGRVFQGYTLEQNAQVKIRDFEKIGDILSQVTGKGANLVGNLQFTVDNPEQFKEQARAKAIEQARAKAENLAKESGINLGKLVNVYENYYPYPAAYNEKSLGMGGAGDAALQSAPDIQPGQQEINVTINLTYQVK